MILDTAALYATVLLQCLKVEKKRKKKKKQEQANGTDKERKQFLRLVSFLNELK